MYDCIAANATMMNYQTAKGFYFRKGEKRKLKNEKSYEMME